MEPRGRAGFAGRRAVLAGASRGPGNRSQGGIRGDRQRTHRRQVIGAAQLGRRHPGDQACRHVVAGRGFRRNGRSDAGIPLSALNQASLGSLAGGALGSPASRVVSSTGVRAKVTAPARSKGPIPLDKVIAKLQEAPDEVQHWNVDEAGLDDLVAKLSTKPGIHAVHLTDGKATAAVAKAATETG